MANQLVGILDIRGLVLHSMHRGEDSRGTRNEETGKVEPRAAYAVESFIESYLAPILENIPPRNILAVWDGGSAFRKGLFPAYKKRRGERVVSDFMRAQQAEALKQVKSLLAAFGILQCRVDGVEADDVIGLLTEKLPGHKLIYTVDQDLLCLRKQGECTVFIKNDPMNALSYNFGSGDAKRTITVPTHLVTLFKSLIGDASDEFPGVAGFGPVKWIELEKEFGTDGLEELDACVKASDFSFLQEAVTETNHPLLALLMEKRYEWMFQYGLAKLHPELCEGVWDNKVVSINWFARVPNKERAIAILNWCGAGDLLHKFLPFFPTFTLVTQENLEEVTNHFVDHIAEAPEAAFDFESVDELQQEAFIKASKGRVFVDVLSQSITGCSICYGDNYQHVIYLSADHKDTPNVADTVIWDFLDEIREQKVLPIAHNAPYEIALIDTNFEEDLGTVIDTRIEALAVDENDSAHLKDLSLRYLAYKQATYKQTLEEAGARNMRELTGPQVLHYGCDDSLVTAWLHRLFSVIMTLEGTYNFCFDQEFDVAYALHEGFEAGIKVDFERMRELAEEDREVITKGVAFIREELADHCAEKNPTGAETLFNDLAEYEGAKLAADGKTAEEISEKLRTLHEKILDGSKYRPLITTKRAVDFKPTQKQINKVINKMGFGAELEGIAKSKINAWVVTARNEVGVTPEQLDFTERLVDALPAFKDREGKAYKAFVELCSQYLAEDAKEEIIGDELNFDSPIQMQILLYAKLGLPIRVRSKVQFNSGRDRLGFQGSPATNDKAIDMALAEDASEDTDWRRQFLLTFREVKQALTRFELFYDPYPLWVHPRDGMIHGGIQNCGTVTRRFTGSSPNLLQLPSKDGGRVRTMVLPKKETHVILSPDLNGEELRITGSLANDPVMIDAYVSAHKKDIHSLTASAIGPIILPRMDPVFADLAGKDMTYDEFVTLLTTGEDDIKKKVKLVRHLAKTVNFLIIYVGKASTLAMNLGIQVDIAKQFIDMVMARYPRLDAWQQESIEFARSHGYVLTSYGNRRHLGEGLFSDNAYIRTKLERQAVNSQVQGTGSDIMKIILATMRRRRTLQRTHGSLIVPPYDEVAVSVPRSAAWDLWCEMKEIMTITPPGHAIPQMPELKCSALNWGTCKELGAEPTQADMDLVFDVQLAERAVA